ncbi:MAG: NAD(P)H-hydrate dehydratase [Planctomycetaceae bacterium]|nr:NAD(P)H-hydrate dehydratase [Planctomycetaceae bacterium]
MTPELVSRRPDPPQRSIDSHKGSFGHVAIIAGRRGMSGAACLAGTAALRGGAGLVTVLVPQSIQPIVAGYEPSYLTIGLPDAADGGLAPSAILDIEVALTGKSAAAIGPGLGQSTSCREVVPALYDQIELPLVCDADALNILAETHEILTRPPDSAPRILTPHPGEFSRLSGVSTAEIQKNRETLAWEYARSHGVILVLKGHQTIITDGRRLSINDTGNPGMATGGTGDVLTGLIVSLLGQGMEPLEAAHLAVWLHGRAGDLAAEELSQPGLIASDLLRFVPRAWKDIV